MNKQMTTKTDTLGIAHTFKGLFLVLVMAFPLESKLNVVTVYINLRKEYWLYR